jgi:Domain of unknown function (DUF4189)
MGCASAQPLPLLPSPASGEGRRGSGGGFACAQPILRRRKIEPLGLQGFEMTSSQDVPSRRNRIVRDRRSLRGIRFAWLPLRLPGLADIVAAAIAGKDMKAHRSAGCGIFGRACFIAFAMAAVIASSGLAGAEGAMAVGIARGGVAKGYATGFAVNQPTVKAARSNAVEQCRRMKNSNADARSGCEVVVTFHNKCVASAIDPESGTPGAGWGLGASQQSADSQALARCRAKAGTSRSEFCEVTDRFCDGSGK